MPRKTLAQAAELEIAWRRHLSRHDVRSMCTKPQKRELLVPIVGTLKYPGRPSLADMANNSSLLRGICEVFPDRTPGIQVIADAVGLLDLYYQGEILQCPGGPGFAYDGYKEACVGQAAILKTLVQRLRRLFRRSEKSRYPCLIITPTLGYTIGHVMRKYV